VSSVDHARFAVSSSIAGVSVGAIAVSDLATPWASAWAPFGVLAGELRQQASRQCPLLFGSGIENRLIGCGQARNLDGAEADIVKDDVIGPQPLRCDGCDSRSALVIPGCLEH